MKAESIIVRAKNMAKKLTVKFTVDVTAGITLDPTSVGTAK